jgi:predicted nucleic-acid-binding protein
MGGRRVKITADTNVLVRTVVEDDAEQAAAARVLLQRASIIAVPVPVFCELAWVLKRAYGRIADDVAAAIEAIAQIDTVITDVPAVDAGLAALRAGGDFADGVIAHQGEALGGGVFASFDRQAVARLRDAGAAAADPSDLIA